MKKRESPPAGAPADPRRAGDRELARFLKPQPPVPIPERVRLERPAGYLAHTLLGNRVYKGPC